MKVSLSNSGKLFIAVIICFLFFSCTRMVYLRGSSFRAYVPSSSIDKGYFLLNDSMSLQTSIEDREISIQVICYDSIVMEVGTFYLPKTTLTTYIPEGEIVFLDDYTRSLRKEKYFHPIRHGEWIYMNANGDTINIEKWHKGINYSTAHYHYYDEIYDNPIDLFFNFGYNGQYIRYLSPPQSVEFTIPTRMSDY